MAGAHAAGGSTGLDGAGDAIDLRTPVPELRLSPLFAEPSPDRRARPAPADRPSSEQPRRRALSAEFGQMRASAVPAAPAAPSTTNAPPGSIADALRELNELRVNETIDELEFKKRKAELFASQRAAAGPARGDGPKRA
jgi:hypothetical protein